jgi:hypothetical protein
MQKHVTPDDSSIVIEVVDVGNKETERHVVRPPGARQYLFPPDPPPHRFNGDNEPTRLDRGLPPGLAKDIALGEAAYEPSSGEIDPGNENAAESSRFLLAIAIIGGSITAILVALILLYFIG